MNESWPITIVNGSAKALSLTLFTLLRIVVVAIAVVK